MGALGNLRVMHPDLERPAGRAAAHRADFLPYPLLLWRQFFECERGQSSHGILLGYAARGFPATPEIAMASGIADMLEGAITCAPAMPGMFASSAISSPQILVPSALASAALSRRSIISSLMIGPKSF